MALRRPAMMCLLILVSPLAHSQAVQAKHAQVELISGASVLGPGQPLLLGVHFVLEKGWHIYWINPGDSGQPAVFQWQLPAGFHAGEVEWPTPEKLQSSSTVADYGYENDVTLLVPIHAPPSLKLGAAVEIAAQAKWLICREVCLSDHAQLHLAVPVSSGKPAGNRSAPALAEAQRRLPKPWPHAWRARAESSNENFVLSLSTGKPFATAQFFPRQANQIENAAPQVLQKSPAGVKIILKKSDQLLKPISVLEGVVVLGSESYRLRAPVVQR